MAGDKIRVSATALSTHTKCPHAFWLSREWRVTTPPAWWLTEGSNIHAVMEGREDPMNSRTRVISSNLAALEKSLGIEAEHRELRQTFEILPGIEVTRIIDVLGHDKDGGVVVDYKSATSPWDTADGSEMYPQVFSWQTVMYLYKAEENWPERMIYLVAGENFTQAFTVYHDEYREKEMLTLLKQIQKEKEEGHIREMGYNCLGCDYQAICYNSPGWQASYRRHTK